MNFGGESYNLGFISRQVLHPKEGQSWSLFSIVGVFFIVLILAIAFIILMILYNPIASDNIEYAERLIEARAQRASELANAIEAITYQFYSNRILNDLLLDYTASKKLTMCLDGIPFFLILWREWPRHHQSLKMLHVLRFIKH